jgi:DNA replication protein DnaC
VTDDDPTRVGDVLPAVERALELRRRAAEGGHLAEPEDPADALPTTAAEQEVRRRRAVWAALVPEVHGDPRVRDLPRSVADPVRRWIAGARLGEQTNLLLFGPVGTGKSHAAYAALRPLVGDGISPVAATSARDLVNAYKPDQRETGARLRRLAVEAYALLVDDIGAEHATEFSAERLAAVLDDRWKARHPIIGTCNLDIEQLTEHLGERAASRLLGDSIIVRVTGPDRRMTTP